jgi:hypothetical protein
MIMKLGGQKGRGRGCSKNDEAHERKRGLLNFTETRPYCYGNSETGKPLEMGVESSHE